MNEETTDFFKRIKAWVRKNNTTIKTLMESIDTTEDIYYGWRKSEKLPSATNVYKLAKIMGVSTDWLISGKEYSEQEPPEVDVYKKRLDCAYEELDEFDRRTIMEMAESLKARHTSSAAQKLA